MDGQVHRQTDALRLPRVPHMPLGAHFVRGRRGDRRLRCQVINVSQSLVRDRGHDHAVLAAARDLRDGHGALHVELEEFRCELVPGPSQS